MGTNEPEKDVQSEDDVPPIEQWIAACKAGSSDEFGNLVEACRDYLLLIANQDLAVDLRAKVGASDMVQETLVLAQRNFGEFRGETEPELLTWLRRILRNHMVDVARKYKQTDKRDVGREQSLCAADSQGMSIDPAANQETPRTGAIAKQEAELLRAALARLPDDAQQVIKLRSWEQLSFAEIGQQMNRSSEAVRKLWSRAIERMAQELERDASDERLA